MIKALILSLALLTPFSWGTDITNVKITAVRTGTWYGEFVTFKVSPAPTSRPNCHNIDPRGHYVIDTSKPGGKQWLSVILSAYATKSTVDVWGTESCIAVNGLLGEELETIELK